MQINNFFMGAYNARRASSQTDFRQISAEKSGVISSKASLAMQEIKKQRTMGASISMSEETKAFLCSEEGYNKMKSDVEELYTRNVMQQKELSQNNESDPFWSNTGNQWLVFSESLYKNGFYDGMSDEEVKEAENTLAKITAGMDHLSRTQYDTGIEFSDFYGHGSNFFMDSNEVNLELTSATAALKMFSDKYVPDDQKEEFNNLIESFNKHNTEIIEGYQSPIESFNRAVNAMQNGKYQNSALDNPHAADLKNGSQNNIDIAGYLGGVSHSSSEKADYQKELTELFEQMRKSSGSADAIWNNIKQSYVDYASKGSDDMRIRSYVSTQAQHTFLRIQGYWIGLD